MSEPAGLLSIRSCRIRYRIAYRFPNALRAAATSVTIWIGSTNMRTVRSVDRGTGSQHLDNIDTSLLHRGVQIVSQSLSLVPLIRGNGKVKTGFRKVVFEVRVGIAVIVTRRSLIEKLSGEHATVTKAKAQPFIHRVFGNQIKFIADVAARAGMRGNRNGSTAGVKVVI